MRHFLEFNGENYLHKFNFAQGLQSIESKLLEFVERNLVARRLLVEINFTHVEVNFDLTSLLILPILLLLLNSFIYNHNCLFLGLGAKNAKSLFEYYSYLLIYDKESIRKSQ